MLDGVTRPPAPVPLLGLGTALLGNLGGEISDEDRRDDRLAPDGSYWRSRAGRPAAATVSPG